MTNEDLKALKVALKSGEYNGVHIMQALIAVEGLITAKTALQEIIELPSVRQDECCNIALNAMDSGL